MKTFAALLATGVCLMCAPAFAGAPATPDEPITLAGARFCVGPGCADRDDDWRSGRRGDRAPHPALRLTAGPRPTGTAEVSALEREMCRHRRQRRCRHIHTWGQTLRRHFGDKQGRSGWLASFVACGIPPRSSGQEHQTVEETTLLATKCSTSGGIRPKISSFACVCLQRTTHRHVTSMPHE